jgi:hypothetical protein
MAPLIHFLCRAKSHQDRRTKKAQTGSPVTFHEGQWAYCPAGVATSHEWEATTPTSREALRRRHLKERGKTTS